jgi:predicted RNase H-like nuclease
MPQCGKNVPGVVGSFSKDQPREMSMTVVGVDACKRGWVIVALGDFRPIVHFIPSIHELAEVVPGVTTIAIDIPISIHELAEVVPGVTTIAIDIPIGILEAGRRAADRLAYDLVGPRRSSVFLCRFVRHSRQMTSMKQIESRMIQATTA